MSKFILLPLSLLLFLTSSCATLFTGISDEVSITSDPEGAIIYIDGEERGATPQTLKINRPGLNHTWISLQKEEYQTTHFILEKEFNKISYLSLLAPVFIVIDIVSGSVTRYNPLEYEISLQPEKNQEKIIAPKPLTE